MGLPGRIFLINQDLEKKALVGTRAGTRITHHALPIRAAVIRKSLNKTG
jgi:hypothetical protein